MQRGCRFCFAAHDGEVTTSRLAEWLSAGRGSAPTRRGLVFAGGPGFATTQTECVMTESRVAKRGL